MRRLGADEAGLLRDLRLRALADAPMAFGSTLAREEAFAAERVGAPGGGLGGRRAPGHVRRGARGGLADGVLDGEDPLLAHLYSMWVAPDARGTGAGRALVDAVVGLGDRARGASG